MNSSSTQDILSSNNAIIKKHSEGTTGDELFYSLCRQHETIKSRPCLRCRKVFKSRHSGHRLCGQCASKGPKRETL